jgi:hypothetical protein
MVPSIFCVRLHDSGDVIRCHTVPIRRRGCGVSANPAPAPSTIESTTIRKLRTNIIPFVFVLFVINFVDRINIGFAALTMNKELAITSQQFGLLSGIFFWGYFHFRDTQQPSSTQARCSYLDCTDIGQLGNCGNPDWLRQISHPSVPFAISARYS